MYAYRPSGTTRRSSALQRASRQTVRTRSQRSDRSFGKLSARGKRYSSKYNLETSGSSFKPFRLLAAGLLLFLGFSLFSSKPTTSLPAPVQSANLNNSNQPLLQKRVSKQVESPPASKPQPLLESKLEPDLKEVEFKESNFQQVSFQDLGFPSLDEQFYNNLPAAESFIDTAGKKISLTLDTRLQKAAEALLEKYQVPFGAIVAVEPSSGRVLTLASRGSEKGDNLPMALRSGFPAASLFKLVTGAAAIEESGMSGESIVSYRGGNYTLSRGNYLPDRKLDLRKMALDEAMGKSVNPVFARVALKNLSRDILRTYAERFGFMDKLSSELPMEQSYFGKVQNDFQLARTAAGFGEVTISPLHAALLAASVANGGIMMRPFIVEAVEDTGGHSLYSGQSHPWGRVMLSSTATELSEMMVKTSTSGTGRKQFGRWKNQSQLKNLNVAGKTGTLSGKNPKGRYHWFIGSAPAEEPDISIAALVIDPGNARINGCALARLFLEEYFKES